MRLENRRLALGVWVAAVLAAGGCATATNGTPVGAPAAGDHGQPVTSAVTVPAPTATTSPGTTSASASGQPPSFSSLYNQEQSGVVRLETVGCDDSGIGTGFLLSPTDVVTVAHVIDQAVVISLIDHGQRTVGTVIGVDSARDLALVRAAHPLDGYHFTLAAEEPAVGDDVGAIGFPIGDPITFTRGNISGLHRSITVGGVPRHDLIETDAAVNPGNSGGPLIGQDGTAYGLVDAKNVQAEGIAYAVPATEAATDVAHWRADNQPPAPARCSDPLGPGQQAAEVAPPGELDPGAANGIADAFTTYFDGINTGDYESAWLVLSPRLRAGSSVGSFANGDATSYDSDVQVLDASQQSASEATVVLSFVSLQRADKGPDGDTCDMWTLRYTMVEGAAGNWLIDSAKPYQGSTHQSC
jgi:serine protease Do